MIAFQMMNFKNDRGVLILTFQYFERDRAECKVWWRQDDDLWTQKRPAAAECKYRGKSNIFLFLCSLNANFIIASNLVVNNSYDFIILLTNNYLKLV